jgi:pimeloyl-ACP methyl ester carboxylesterase
MGPPVLAGVTREFVDLPPSRDGRSLRMHVATAGEGPPLLLLHGAPQNHLEWSQLIARYAEHFRVICPDLRGAGWTDAPGRGYDPASLTADLTGLLAVYDVQRVSMIAHDWSAIIAFLMATDHPDMIDRLVILSIPDLFVRVDTRVVRLLAQGWFDLVLPLPVVGPAAVRGGRQATLRYMQSLTGSAYGNAQLPHADLDRRLLRDARRARDLCRLYRHTIVPALVGLTTGRYRHRRLSVPTLQLIGDEDPAALLMRMGRHEGRASSLESQVISGAGHFLVDEAGDEVFQRSMQFLL